MRVHKGCTTSLTWPPWPSKHLPVSVFMTTKVILLARGGSRPSVLPPRAHQPWLGDAARPQNCACILITFGAGRDLCERRRWSQIFDSSVAISDSSGAIARVFSGAMSPRPLPPDVTHCLGRDVVLVAKLYHHARRLVVLLLVDQDGVTCRQPDSIATDNLCHCLPRDLIIIDCGGKAGECKQRTDIIRVRGCGSPGAWTPCKRNV